MKKGFTVVEMLVVVAVISILAGIALFSANSIRSKAGFTRAKEQMDELATGAFLYYQDTGTWAPDISLHSTGGNHNALFYTSQYINIKDVEPFTYLGSTYRWDWQNWGNYDATGYPNNRTFSRTQSFGNMCWEAVDLYREPTTDSFNLVMRKCIRDTCTNQKYCNEQGKCWNTAAGRDAGNDTSPDYVGQYASNGPVCDGGKGCSAICEPCTYEGPGPGSCYHMFRP